ncbi:hypothetical protein ACFL1X_03750 [Candidatus Hydrogenedentota bacterium]
MKCKLLSVLKRRVPPATPLAGEGEAENSRTRKRSCGWHPEANGLSYRLRNRHGVAIMELVCSITILAMIMAATSMIIGRSMTQTNNIRQRLIANRVLASEADRMRAAGYDSLHDGDNLPLLFADDEHEKLGLAELTITVKEHDSANPGLKELEMALTWGSEYKRRGKKSAFMLARKARHE